MYQRALAFKYAIIRLIRYTYKYVNWSYNFASFIRERKLFRDVEVGSKAVINVGGRSSTTAGTPANAPTKRTKVIWKARLQVGGNGKFAGADGSGFSWKFGVIEKPTVYLEKLSLPPGMYLLVHIL